MSGNEARPGADSFSFCMFRIIQISVVLSCIIAVTESTSFQIIISTGFPTLPSFCLLQLGPSGHFPRCGRVCVWEKRGRKREKEMREMFANRQQKNLPWIPETEWKVSWGFSLHARLSPLFGPVFAGALRSPWEPLKKVSETTRVHLTQSQPSPLDSECFINTFKALYTSRLTEIYWSTGTDNGFIHGVIRLSMLSLFVCTSSLLSVHS